jgi:hypothetical protein
MFLLCCIFVKGQEAKTSSAQTLQNSMSVKVLAAYQENTSNKVADLFSYFQLLTDTSLTDEVKKEIISNINLLFDNQNPMVIDFTSEEKETIPLQTLIQKLLVSEPILFKVSEELKYHSLTDKGWNTTYVVKKTKANASNYVYTSQTVTLLLEDKKFGESSKTIWTTFLGTMN